MTRRDVVITSAYLIYTQCRRVTLATSRLRHRRGKMGNVKPNVSSPFIQRTNNHNQDNTKAIRQTNMAANETTTLEYKFIRLEPKPSAQLSYCFIPATANASPRPSLIVFVNGLGRPQTSWTRSITQLRNLSPTGLPAILTYDRYGQGQSQRDPVDDGAPDPAHAHDCISAVRDMRQLVRQIAEESMNVKKPDETRLIFVGNSIGCALIRIYAQQYPGTIAGALFLDSTLTNSDFVSLIPNPDDAECEPPVDDDLANELRKARHIMGKLFHPDVGSKEGLSRRNLGQLLPHSHSPSLQGCDGRGPYLTVVGHDLDAFAADSEQKLGIPRHIFQTFVNPFWQNYNEGLAQLTEPHRAQGPFQAPGASHFIQDDNPDFTAERLLEIVRKTGCEA